MQIASAFVGGVITETGCAVRVWRPPALTPDQYGSVVLEFTAAGTQGKTGSVLSLQIDHRDDVLVGLLQRARG